jgi:hypothetical protein
MRFWLTEEKKSPGHFEDGCTYLNFDKMWKIEKIGFNDEELEELRRVLGIGMGDCDHCNAWQHWLSHKQFAEDEERRGKTPLISYDMKRLTERVFLLEKKNEEYENDNRAEKWRKDIDDLAEDHKTLSEESAEHLQHFERHDAVLDVMNKNIRSAFERIAKVDSHLNTLATAYGSRLTEVEKYHEAIDSLTDEQDIHTHGIHKLFEEIEVLKGHCEVLDLAFRTIKEGQNKVKKANKG